MFDGEWRLAARNLFRHRRRSVSALLAIGLGVMTLLIASGFIQWIFWAMREATIQSQLGHIQVVKRDYFKHGLADPFRYLLPEHAPQVEIIRRTPHVAAVTPRLFFSGLISHGETTVSFVGAGVQPDTERRVSRQLAVIQGHDLGEDGGVILGEGLAGSLGVSPGDKVVLLVNTASGGINALELTVQGLFRTAAKAYDDVALRIPIDQARTLVRAAGAHEWVVLLDDTERTPEVLRTLRSELAAADSNLELVPWYDQADFYNKTVTLFSRQVDVVWILIAVVMVLSISNTMIMSVLERTREIGTLLAMGFRRRRIRRQFLKEGAVLGAAGGLAGLAVALILGRIISVIGIPMPPPPGMAVGYIGQVMITWPLVSEALLLGLVSSVIASLYPAWKASRMEIVDALRYYG